MTDDGCRFCTQYTLRTRPCVWASWGEKYGQSSDMIAETRSLYIIAGLGALTEGYLLLLPKVHYLSIGSLTQTELAELVAVKEVVARYIRQFYGPAVFFEHGSSSINRAGGCTDHAHLHVCPSDSDFRPYLRSTFREQKISGLEELGQYAKADIPYLFYENAHGDKYVYALDEYIPSQFLRKVWAKCVGKPGQWNWSEFIGEENIARTISRMRDALAIDQIDLP